MAQPSFPLYPTLLVPPPEMSIRSRREIYTRDAGNARQFEHWQTDGKSMTNNRPDPNGQAPFHEFLPINSRFESRNYMSQPRYDTTGASLGTNTYFDKYDTNYDSRNAARELQSVVYEDKNIDNTKENNSMMTRHFTNRWFKHTPEEQKEQVEVSTSLRPIMDDYQVVYKPI